MEIIYFVTTGEGTSIHVGKVLPFPVLIMAIEKACTEALAKEYFIV